MNIFNYRSKLIEEYSSYVRSFIQIKDIHIREHVDAGLEGGVLWPEPLIQLNPSFEPGALIDSLVAERVLHQECSRVFRRKSEPNDTGKPLRLHRHQEQAIRNAQQSSNYVLTTGTGSGKSLAYIVPIVNHVLQRGSGKGIQAIVIYPMNALANSQFGELEKFLCHGYPDRQSPVTFKKYTGQESEEERLKILMSPPDILQTNFVMLELILTRPQERKLISSAKGLRYLVLDELHTYRGRQGADVALLVRRVRDFLEANTMQCVGTSATMAGGGSFNEQCVEVARVASLLFGTNVEAKNIIGETLRRATDERAITEPAFVQELAERIKNYSPPTRYQDFVHDPVSIWIESTLGLRRELTSGRLVRATPRSISGNEGLAHELNLLTSTSEERCAAVLEQALLGGYGCEPDPETGFPLFAFRLHQFISRGDTVYASVEPEEARHITTQGQQFVPGDRSKYLFPLAFCRECGQEYYVVREVTSSEGQQKRFVPRKLNDQSRDDHQQAGFLFHSSSNPWPADISGIIERVPEDWVELRGGSTVVRSERQKYLPKGIIVGTDGNTSEGGTPCHFVPSPFRFCLNCGVSYGMRERSDFGKLASLSSEGRSTATTILSLSAILGLRKEASLQQRARKLLSFTDNRQDASLQAGHFNDFVEVGLIRSGLYEAVRRAGDSGLRHEVLTQSVFDALALPIELYAVNPNVRFQQKNDTERAFRQVLGYRLYRDLKRGWRVTSPNLEQCGLLEIRYPVLEELCNAHDEWNGCHQTLVSASAETRMKIAKVLLDFMRRELAVKVDYLDQRYLEQVQQLSSQYLIAPWAIDEKEIPEYASILFPRSRTHEDYGGHVFLSPRSGFGQYLRRPTTFPGSDHKLSTDDASDIIKQLLHVLSVAGLVQESVPAEDGSVPGYQIPASALSWYAGDASKIHHDPIRVPNIPEEGAKPNTFFVEFYKNVAAETKGLEAREHTAQVDYEDRVDRETRFRTGQLPILYCSPTMELGVDIAELNVVNMRNVPPTPANYAQRSGRAGRSGQPALVFSYCSTGSSHDQYFFKRPENMVAGSVLPPRLDLVNEDLVRAHVQAVWLTESGLSLGKSVKDILNVEGAEPSLEIVASVEDALAEPRAKERAKLRAIRILSGINSELNASDWYTDHWIDEVFAQLSLNFGKACDRWRTLYRSALSQAKAQDAIIRDATRRHDERRQAEQLRREAESQLKLLMDIQNVVQSDFYSYRYFASEGFLPGYNFPRLPISAYISSRRVREKDEFLSRPRFLAISEFGPRAVVYHEGAKYIINKVIMPVGSDDVLTQKIKLCEVCGYLHMEQNNIHNNCDRCGQPLGLPMSSLFRMQNVVTKKRDRINSDEEERVRLGYELITSVKFADVGGNASFKTASLKFEGNSVAQLQYGNAATIWRINLGWMRRKDKEQKGFVLDVERGYWARNDEDPDDPTDPLSGRTAKVIPFVEDRRNALMFEPNNALSPTVMASLQSAIKNAIQVEYELEDNELAAEPLPKRDDRRLILLYESAEGGAGILRRLVDDADAFARIARRALLLCHFNPDTGEDLRRAVRAREDCEAACYDCLMTYSNQSDHDLLDRKAIVELLMSYAKGRVHTAPTAVPRAQHLENLMKLTDSELERKWLRLLEEKNLHLPSSAQVLIERCQTRPDFVYDEHLVAIYIDGPPHDYPERRKRDEHQTECMENAGFTVIRFAHSDDWLSRVAEFPNVFGRLA